MNRPDHILSAGVTLMPGVPLNVYAIRGSGYSVLIDTGIASMTDAIVAMCRDAGNVRFVLLTHAHVDHMGASGAVRVATGASFGAAGALDWFEDLETHYREFCLPGGLDAAAPQDSPELKAEILGLVDGPSRIDLLLEEGTTFRLDDTTALRTIRLPGHKLEEIAFLDEERGDLFLADVLLALPAPFFHGFETAQGFRASLDRLDELIGSGRVGTVYAAHHDPMDAGAALAAVAATRGFLDDVRTAVLEAAVGVTFTRLWQEVSAALGKEPEFRGYAMLRAEVGELAEEGQVTLEAEMIRRIS